MQSKIRTLLYEDNPDLRLGMTYLLKSTPSIELAGAFENCRNVAAEVRALRPDVILMDIDMPGISGIEATAVALAVRPEARVLMLTVFEDEERIFAALRNGASGYLLKEMTPSAIVDAVLDVHRGGSPLTPKVAKKIVRYFHQEGPKTASEYHLSPREQEILGYLVKGHSYKEIADLLFISVETVRTHIRHIYEKLQVHTKTEAVLKAVREKLVE